MIFCKIQEAMQKGETECACGHQRYCPKERKSIFTQDAFNCPIRENYEKDKYGDSRNAGGVQYAELGYQQGHGKKR